MDKSDGGPARAPVHGNIVLAGIGRDGSAIVNGTECPGAVRRLFLTSSPTRGVTDSDSVIRVREGAEMLEAWKAAVAGSSLVVAVASTGGREEACAPELLELSRDEGAVTVAVLVEPLFAVPPHRVDAGARLVREVTQAADATIMYPADSRGTAGQTMAEAMAKWMTRLRLALQGLLAAAAADDAMNLEFADLAALFSGRCRATVAVGQGPTIEDALRDATANSLSPSGEIETARCVVAHVRIDGAMLVEDAAHAASALAQAFPKAEVCCGVSVQDGLGAVCVTVLAGKLDVGPFRPSPTERTSATESPFFKAGDPAIYDGENLDVPAYLRKRVALPGGPPQPVASQKTLFGGAVSVRA